MGLKEARSGRLAVPERMPTVPAATRSRVIGGMTPIQLTDFPEKNGDAAEVNQ